MMQSVIHSLPARRPVPGQPAPRNARGLLSLTYPSKELFRRQRALLRRMAPAGFSSHAPDEHSTRHPGSTFFMRVAGDLMRGLGIFDGDLLVVDRALPAAHGCVVIAVLDGEFTVRQLLHTAEGLLLRAGHPDHPDRPVKAEPDFSIWGVVRWNVHRA